jgi:hypothetical protein
MNPSTEAMFWLETVHRRINSKVFKSKLEQFDEAFVNSGGKTGTLDFVAMQNHLASAVL